MHSTKQFPHIPMLDRSGSGSAAFCTHNIDITVLLEYSSYVFLCNIAWCLEVCCSQQGRHPEDWVPQRHHCHLSMRKPLPKHSKFHMAVDAIPCSNRWFHDQLEKWKTKSQGIHCFPKFMVFLLAQNSGSSDAILGGDHCSSIEEWKDRFCGCAW